MTITGIAWDADFSSWSLDYGSGASPSSWTSLVPATNTTVGDPATQTSDQLTVWSTGSLSGVYTVRLTVADGAGNVTILTSTVYVANTDRGSEAYHTYVPFDLAGGWNLGVNVATGEARLSRDLFSIPSFGPAQSLGLTYNSADQRTGDPLSSPFGSGWSSNLTSYLDLSDQSSGFIAWHRSDGAEVPFGLMDGVWTPLSGHYKSLTIGSGSYTITYLDHSSISYDSSGRLAAISDRFGLSLTIGGWGSGTVTATDASGRATTVVFANARISRVTNSAGRAWGFAYTGSDLTSITDPLGNATTLGYDGSHQLDSVTRNLTKTNGDGTHSSPAQVAWGITYTTAAGYAGGRVATVTDPIQATDSIATSFDYGATFASGPTVVTHPGDGSTGTPALTTTYTLDPNGRGWVDRVASTWPGTPQGSAITDYTYDPSGNGNIASISRQMDATHWSTQSWTYDSAGRVLTQTDPLAWTSGGAYSTSVTTYTYDRVGDVQTKTVSGSSVSPAISVKTAYIYDSAGHLCLKVDNLTVDPTDLGCTSTIPAATSDSDIVTRFAYNGSNELTTATDPHGVVTKYDYDAHGNQIGMTRNYVAGGPTDDVTNIVTTYTPDAAGNTISQTDPITNIVIPAVTATTTRTYDELGRLRTITTPGDAWVPGSKIVTGYDEWGESVSSTSGLAPIGCTELVHVRHDIVRLHHSRLTGPGHGPDRHHRRHE